MSDREPPLTPPDEDGYEDEDGWHCYHPRGRITRWHGGVACNACGEIFQEPVEDWEPYDPYDWEEDR